MKLRFPANNSVDVVKRLRKIQRLDFKIWKNEADLEFLRMCDRDRLTSEFFDFKLANSSFKH